LYQTFLPLEDTVPVSRRHSNPERSSVAKAVSGPRLIRPFFASHGQQVEFQFVIGHFAGKVMYDLDAFLQKNQDALPVEAITLCNESTTPLVQALLAPKAAKGAAKAPRLARVPSSLRAASVSSQFRSQLDELIAVIGSTQARYIRCVKSNDTAAPRLLHKPRVVQQLRSGGVLEAVRIARAGYAVRVDHAAFAEQFGFLLPPAKKTKAPPLPVKTKCERIVATLLLTLGAPEVGRAMLAGGKCSRAEFQDACGHAGFQLGHSKVFFRKEVYNELRLLRRNKLSACAVAVQRCFRGYVARVAYATARAALLVLQRWAAAALATKRRRASAATRLQTLWRRYRARTAYVALRTGVDALQRFWRSRRVWLAARAIRDEAQRLEAEAAAERARAAERETLEQQRAQERLRIEERLADRSPLVSPAASMVPPLAPTVSPRCAPAAFSDESASAVLVENLTLQNEKLRLELELLRQQTAPAPTPRAVDELTFAHQQIVSLSQQLLATQIKYSNLLMEYDESVHGYDADRPSLSEDAFALVDDLAVPCPDSLECAQEQLRTLLRKLHVAKEKLKNLEADRKPRGDSIEGLDFYPRKSTEWRPHFYPPLDELDCDSDADEVDLKVDELQRQVDGLRAALLHKRSGASVPSTASTASDLVEARRPPRRLTYHVRDITKWARAAACFECKSEFTWFTRRHHCRLCGNSFCHEHSNRRACLIGAGSDDDTEPVRVCDMCFVEICFEARKAETPQRRFPLYV
ncbi:myosin-like protein, partial [Achlya hypogyna]